MTQQDLIQAAPPIVKGKSVKFPLYSVSLVRESVIPGQAGALDSPAKTAALLAPLMCESDREKFVVVLLNTRNGVIGVNVVSVGTVSASLVHPRELFKPAILAGAAAIIVAHNHPSNDISPSPEDRECTRRIVKAGELLGIPLLDHVIVGSSADRFYSFREGGLL